MMSGPGHHPWIFGHNNIVPGASTMAQCALAAYQTVPEDFVLHCLQTNFPRAASRDKELVYKVQRLSTGKRTAVRLVTVEQGGRNVISATISFTKPPSSESDPVLTHAVLTSTEMGDGVIRLDDFVHLRKADGPFLEAERLPIVPTGMTPSFITVQDRTNLGQDPPQAHILAQLAPSSQVSPMLTSQ